MNNNNLKPFKLFALKNFPFIEADFDAITNYELLCKIVEYLNNVIASQNDVINEVSILSQQFIDLKTYVDNFFDNLDVQEEINNKLDIMATDGTLEEIINQEIFGAINNNLDILNSERTVFIGDSYGAGVTNESGVYITSWIDYMIQKMHLTSGNYYKIATPGAGFIREGSESGYNFIESLQAEIDNITNKNTIKNVIVCGGYNDNTYQLSNIQNAITTFVNYCKTQFPNATVYIGCIGYRYGNNNSDVTTKSNLQTVYYAYSNITPSQVNRTNDYVYLHGVENILKSAVKLFMYENNAHPTEAGQIALANGIYQAFKKGICEIYQNNSLSITPVGSGTYSGNMYVTYTNDQLLFRVDSATFNWDSGSMSLTNGGTKLADATANDFIGTVTPALSSISCWCNIQDYNLGRYIVPASLFFDKDGSVMIYLWGNNSNTGQSLTFSDVKQIIVYRSTTTIPAILN